ncbi:MAG: hypothetical protein HYV32_05695 [Candidatus Kerfeldbacteria bacterium]|nr:hypothetical protein [Candidatus Kerfeldbacteria bacterium]
MSEGKEPSRGVENPVTQLHRLVEQLHFNDLIPRNSTEHLIAVSTTPKDITPTHIETASAMLAEPSEQVRLLMNDICIIDDNTLLNVRITVDAEAALHLHVTIQTTDSGSITNMAQFLQHYKYESQAMQNDQRPGARAVKTHIGGQQVEGWAMQHGGRHSDKPTTPQENSFTPEERFHLESQLPTTSEDFNRQATRMVGIAQELRSQMLSVIQRMKEERAQAQKVRELTMVGVAPIDASAHDAQLVSYLEQGAMKTAHERIVEEVAEQRMDDRAAQGDAEISALKTAVDQKIDAMCEQWNALKKALEAAPDIATVYALVKKFEQQFESIPASIIDPFTGKQIRMENEGLRINDHNTRILLKERNIGFLLRIFESTYTFHEFPNKTVGRSWVHKSIDASMKVFPYSLQRWAFTDLHLPSLLARQPEKTPQQEVVMNQKPYLFERHSRPGTEADVQHTAIELREPPVGLVNRILKRSTILAGLAIDMLPSQHHVRFADMKMLLKDGKPTPEGMVLLMSAINDVASLAKQENTTYVHTIEFGSSEQSAWEEKYVSPLLLEAGYTLDVASAPDGQKRWVKQYDPRLYTALPFCEPKNK